MGEHVITIRSTGTHTHPKHGGTVRERAAVLGSAEQHALEAVEALRKSGHQVHSATLTHHAGTAEESMESLIDV